MVQKPAELAGYSIEIQMRLISLSLASNQRGRLLDLAAPFRWMSNLDCGLPLSQLSGSSTAKLPADPFAAVFHMTREHRFIQYSRVSMSYWCRRWTLKLDRSISSTNPHLISSVPLPLYDQI